MEFRDLSVVAGIAGGQEFEADENAAIDFANSTRYSCLFVGSIPGEDARVGGLLAIV
jgi:hypothetical protein